VHAVLVRLPGNSESQSVSTAGPPSELEHRGLGEGAAPGCFGASGSRTLRTVLALVFAAVFGAGTARAQQTLFNVPSADVLDKGKTYVEVDDLYGGDPDVQVITIRGVQDCQQRGFKSTGFFEVDTQEAKDWTIRLTDPSEGGAKPK